MVTVKLLTLFITLLHINVVTRPNILHLLLQVQWDIIWRLMNLLPCPNGIFISVAVPYE